MTGNCARGCGPATCIGRYESEGSAELGCDRCCLHGNEDGWCVMLDADYLTPQEIARLRALPPEEIALATGLRAILGT